MEIILIILIIFMCAWSDSEKKKREHEDFQQQIMKAWAQREGLSLPKTTKQRSWIIDLAVGLCWMSFIVLLLVLGVCGICAVFSMFGRVR